MNKFIVECIGTFFLVLNIGLTVIPGSAGVIAPLAIGSVLMVLVYAGGHISGAHYNPAVTLAVLIRGKCTMADVPVYLTAQILGAVAGALTAQFLVGSGTAAGAIDVTMDPAINY
jgi:aquaporin Z